MRINTNPPNLLTQRRYRTVSEEQNKQTMRLATGDRITRAAYDPAGLAISENLRYQIRSQQQAERNANDSVSMLQVAEGSLSTVSNIGTRMRELAIQSATDTLSSSERAMIQLEFKNMSHEVKRILKATKFNGRGLLDGDSRKYDFQVGINNKKSEDRISYDMSKVLKDVDKLDTSSISLGSKHGSQRALAQLDEFINQVGQSRAVIGGMQRRMGSVVQNIQIGKENLSSSKSKIRDVNIAEAVSKKASSEIQQSAVTSLLSQTSATSKNVMKLLD